MRDISPIAARQNDIELDADLNYITFNPQQSSQEDSKVQITESQNTAAREHLRPRRRPIHQSRADDLAV